MKAETWIFGLCSIFFVLVAPSYWFITGDHTGTTALVMTFLLTTLITFYLGAHARKMQPRPEDSFEALLAELVAGLVHRFRHAVGEDQEDVVRAQRDRAALVAGLWKQPEHGAA